MEDVYIHEITERIEKQCFIAGRAIHVEEIQDKVLDELARYGHFKLMRHYSEYRLQHDQQRRQNTTDGKILSLIERNNEEAKQENANKNPVINSTQRDYIAGEVSRDITRRILLPEDVLHIPGLGYDGLVGMSPIAACRNAVGMGLAAD